MSAKFYTLLTDIGAAKLANAAALGVPLKITQMAVGDGGGVLPTPNAQQTKLVGEKRRAALNMLYIDPQNSSQVIAEQVIPETEGGWWIREVGLFDETGALIAVGNCPESYKPQLAEGSGRTQTVRMVLITSSTDNITLKIDPSVVLATRQYVDDKVLELKVYVGDLMAKHLADVDPHSQYASKDSPTLTGTPKTPTPPAGNNSALIASTAFVQAAILALIGGAPATLDTLKEIAAAINNDPNFSTTINNALALKAPLVSPALTGTPTAPTAAQTVNNTQIATTAFVKAAVAGLVGSSPEALDTLNELAAALGNDPNFATTMTNALANKQPLDNTLTSLSGKDAAGIIQYLGLGTAAKKNIGANPGDVVTAASDQPVYNSTLPTSGYTSTEPSGYMGAATVTGGDTLVRLVGLIAHNIAGNWTLVNSYGSHFGTGGSIEPNDAAHVFVSTDGASYTRRWYLYNNGRLVGPEGDFADQAWVTGKTGSVSGITSTGEGIDVQEVKIPNLPNIGYNATSSRGVLATATAQSDSVNKAHSIQLNNPGSWGLNMSWGTYTGASGSVADVAHLLCSSDGAAYVKRWWFYNNGDAIGPAGKLYSEKNTTKAADGTLKAASPVVKLFADGGAETNAESEGCTVTRLSVGEYLICGCIGLNADAAWGGTDGGFDVPTDRNKQPLIWLDYEINPDGSVLVKTYHRTHPDSPVFARNEREGYSNGDPIDIPSDQYVSVRVEMPENCIYQQKQEAARQAAYESWLALLHQAEEEAYQEDKLREKLLQVENAKLKESQRPEYNG
ncbi:phage tail protein [Enterobacter asburiae]|uniref:phage tail protein n=2 Tax=Enterobacter asburiae TaxID=61645 RepID=UPI002ADE90F3|nr:phage tail protein [Enterobacter asburiae]MEA1020155.1 phage tail protein [Enterobacter asburiae]